MSNSGYPRWVGHGHTCSGKVTKEYNAWANMVKRCTNKNVHKYRIYGGRGITVCDKWIKFDAFLEDMGEAPKGYTLERIDTNGNYCKENCVWATPKQQANNKRNNRIISYKGMKMTVSQWADYLGVNYDALRQRLHRGWSIEEAMEKPYARIR